MKHGCVRQISSVQNSGWSMFLEGITTQHIGSYHDVRTENPVINRPVNGMTEGFEHCLKSQSSQIHGVPQMRVSLNHHPK